MKPLGTAPARRPEDGMPPPAGGSCEPPRRPPAAGQSGEGAGSALEQLILQEKARRLQREGGSGPKDR